jgi:hypothetical protein
MADGPHRAPPGLGKRGKKLWSAVVDEFGLDEHELALLEDACRTADLVQRLEDCLADGVMTDAYGGRVHPAAIEIRQQRLALARLLVALRVPTGDEEAEQPAKGQRRQRRGMRGLYAIGEP